MSRPKLVRFLCPDPRYNFVDIDLSPDDIVIPVPGVFLGGAKTLVQKISRIPNVEKCMFVFKPHHPCAAVPNAETAYKLGRDYAECMQHLGYRSISLFLGEHAVELHDPLCDATDKVVQNLYIDASYAQRKHYNKNEAVKIEEIVISNHFRVSDLTDLTPNALPLSSDFLGLNKGLSAIKGVLGGIFPKRNYISVPAQTQDLLEAAFMAA